MLIGDSHKQNIAERDAYREKITQKYGNVILGSNDCIGHRIPCRRNGRCKGCRVDSYNHHCSDYEPIVQTFQSFCTGQSIEINYFEVSERRLEVKIVKETKQKIIAEKISA